VSDTRARETTPRVDGALAGVLRGEGARRPWSSVAAWATGEHSAVDISAARE
jgi:hypothetical protein